MVRTTSFKKNHELEFGLQVTSVDPGGTGVLSVMCLFCEKYGREAKVGSKRSRTTNVKYYKAPFRKELYEKHNSTQHPLRWTEYRSLSREGKKGYFMNVTPVRESLHRYFGHKQAPLTLHFDTDIVEVLICEKLFHPDDAEGLTKQRAMQSFKLSAEGERGHHVKISNPLQHHIAIDYLSVGMSFRMAMRAIQMTKERTGLAALGSVSQAKVAECARITCAANYQKLKTIIESVWTFSVAFDMATHMSSSYLDIRVRFCCEGELHNFHVVALPVFERHTGENIYKEFASFIQTLARDWKDKLLSVATDGERKMTGHRSGAISRIGRETSSTLIRVWCGAHQLDIVMQKAFERMFDGRFYDTLTALIGHLRRQQNLISEMRTKAPTVAATRWLSMSIVTLWFRNHRVRIQEHLTEKSPSCAPSDSWWIVLLVVCDIAADASITFKSLQGFTTLLAEQVTSLQRLRDIYSSRFKIVGPLEEAEQIESTADTVRSPSKKYSMKLSDMLLHIESLGSYAIDAMGRITEEEQNDLLRSVGEVVVGMAEGIAGIVAVRDAANSPVADTYSLIPVLPRPLAELGSRSFGICIREHRKRLLATFDAVTMQKIEDQYRDFQRSYEQDQDFKLCVDSVEDSASFGDAWKVVGNRYELLRSFVGGIATVFPGTSAVESDFSILNWEKSESRASLTDFSLEGILHAKQASLLDSILAA